jgi:hypothetical protein
VFCLAEFKKIVQNQKLIKNKKKIARPRNLDDSAHARFSRDTEMDFGLQPRQGKAFRRFTSIFKTCKNAHAYD